jgi:hypothetical protein
MRLLQILWVMLAIVGVPSTGVLVAQVPMTRARGDTLGVAAPCDSTPSTHDWPELAVGGLTTLRFRMRVPPEAFEVLHQATGPLFFSEFRTGRGERSLSYVVLTAAAGGTIMSGPQLSVVRRCDRFVGPNVITYWSARVGDVYLAGARWGWAGPSRGRALLMYATGPDSTWQARALAAMRSAVLDTVEWTSPSRP